MSGGEPTIETALRGAAKRIHRPDCFDKPWGEGLVGNVGMSLIGFVAAIPLVLIAVSGIIVGTPPLTIPLAIALGGSIALAILSSALSVVYQTALYRFAVNQQVTAFSPHLLQSAFRQR